MADFIDNLQRFGFTRYEAMLLQTLTRYESLNASDLAKFSGVPHPKVYPTVDKLEVRGLVETLPQGKKSALFKIKPKHMIQAHIEELAHDITTASDEILHEIDVEYNSQKAHEIPIFGVAGVEAVVENLIQLVDVAQSEIMAIFPGYFFSPDLIRAFQEKTKANQKIQADIVLYEPDEVAALKQQLPKVRFHHVDTKAFDRGVKGMAQMFSMFSSRDNTGIMAEILTNVVGGLKERFGVFIVDGERSLTVIPFPIKLHIALVCTVPEMVGFQYNGVKALVESFQK